jgi:hypothetical protein
MRATIYILHTYSQSNTTLKVSGYFNCPRSKLLAYVPKRNLQNCTLDQTRASCSLKDRPCFDSLAQL